MPPRQRLPIAIILGLTAGVCIVTLLSAAARIYDLATARAGTGLSAVDTRHLEALQTVMSWSPAAPAYQDAHAHIVGISEHFRAHKVATMVHVVSGVVVLMLGGLQFFHGLRRRVPKLHRCFGRTLLPLAAITGASGLYLGAGVPYAGVAEALPTMVFAVLFLAFVACAYRAARAGDYGRHREWVIRMFSLAAGVGTVRAVGLGLVSAGMGLRDLIGWSFWLGWVMSLAVAEWWIRRTRVTLDLQALVGAGFRGRAL